MVNVCDCHSTSRSSSWKRLFRESTFNQKSDTKSIEQLFMWPESWSKIRKKFKVYPWSTGKKYLGKWRLCWLTVQFGCQQRKPMYSPIQYCAWENQWKSRKGMEGENRLVYEFIPMSRIGSNRLGVDGWKNFSGFTTLQILAEIQNMMTETQCEPEHFPGRIIFMSMYNDIVWGEKRKRRLVYWEIPNRSRICKKIRARTLVVSWAWIRKEMVRNSPVQTEWKMRWCRWGHDAQLQWKWTSRIPWIRCFGTRRFEMQSKGQIVYTLLWRRQNRGSGSSHNHFRQSAQCLRRSSGHVRRNGLQNLWLCRKYRETCCSEQFRDNEQNASDQWLSARKLACCTIDHLQSIKLCSNGTVFHDPRRCGTWHIWRSREGEGGELMSSVYSTSRQRTQHPK